MKQLKRLIPLVIYLIGYACAYTMGRNMMMNLEYNLCKHYSTVSPQPCVRGWTHENQLIIIAISLGSWLTVIIDGAIILTIDDYRDDGSANWLDEYLKAPAP